MSLEKEALSTIPIWVHLPALPMEYWGERCIRKIAGLLGNVLKIDNATKNKDRLMYARTLVETDIRKGLPDEVFFTNEYDELKPPRREWVNKESQKDQTKAQIKQHHDNSETCETMAIQSPEGNIESESQCTTITEPRGEPHKTLQQGKNVRGLNKANKQAEVVHFIANHISLFSLLETKVKRQGIGALYQIICPSWCITYNLALQKGGMIIVAWRAEEMKVDIRFVSSQIIHLIVNPNVGDNFNCSFVYGATDKKERGIMLTELENIGTTVTGPWIVMGDFNYIANLNERIGQKSRLHEIEPLRRCMVNCDIHDMKSTGRFFTWSNKQRGNARVLSKINRELENSAW
ncbi:uncharacterized protein LOC130809184 [Amaranthus tricolor]|uniref:uncharacterized protein LOC130809184 n=1 Tax=Amaranthus tricolor TaxID=29722 RepID=UPI0025884F42|nr:uncharacterized protein LOC130809184 [Amaranthus tricolor]